MEELAGKIWDRFMTRVTDTRHAQAAVTLPQIARTAGILFRALGGDAGLDIKAAQATEHGARRNWLQRLAGSGSKTELAWRDFDALYLPEEIALFPERTLNRDLYLWLIALAAEMQPGDWFVESQRATLRVFERYPGFAPRYRQLVEAALRLRPNPDSLPVQEAMCEAALQAALREPGSVAQLPGYASQHPISRSPLPLWDCGRVAAQQRGPTGVPLAGGRDRVRGKRWLQFTTASPPPQPSPLKGEGAPIKPWQPVPLWLHPHPPVAETASAQKASDPAGAESTPRDRIQNDTRRRSAEHVDMPDGKDGFMLFFRAESILSWADYIRVNRPNEDDEDSDPSAAANDFNKLSMARDGKTTAARVRFDLDLPPEHADDTPLGPGILLPEWQHKTRQLVPGYCKLQPMLATTAAPCALPAHLATTARRIRRQFEALTPGRIWLNHQFDGSELDLEACIEHQVDRHLRRPAPERGLYRDIRTQQRDLACLLLADLSLSTDAYVSNEARVINVIRDSLFLFSEALSVTGDRFGLYGFSSLRRDNVRFHVLKDFSERYNSETRGRIAALKPGYYTRMGAAIRHATTILSEQKAQQRLMLILTDGKPNDLDQYEGRYGLEDTRHAILQAREQGLQPFCVTVDEKGADYLSHVFGLGRYVIIRKPSELPKQLPRLYAQLTR